MLRSILNHVKKRKSLQHLEVAHSFIITSGYTKDECVLSELITAAAVLGSEYSLRIISGERVFFWNVYMRATSASKNPNDSFKAFALMLGRGTAPDHLTYPFVLRAAARLSRIELGKAVHSQQFRSGFAVDVFISNSTVHMYGSCGDMGSARKAFDEMCSRNAVSWNSLLCGFAKNGDVKAARNVFEEMQHRDIVTWSAMIDGYVKSGDASSAIAVFEEMLEVGPSPNEVTVVSALRACAMLGDIGKGKSMHRYIKERRLPASLELRTSLINMYAKCGDMEEALAVFGASDRSDVLMWNAVIGGLGSHGMVKEAMDMFAEMVERVEPDDITYLSMLSACAHAGMVEEARGLFGRIREPKDEHYACLVNAMARAGEVEEAFGVVKGMGEGGSASMMGAVLSGCVRYGKMQMGEEVGKMLVKVDPKHDGRYVGLANVYADLMRWDKVDALRNNMETIGVKKCAGRSLATTHCFS